MNIAIERVHNEEVGASETHYGSTVKTTMNAGYTSYLIVSSAGTITVTQQFSVDGSTFFDPVDTVGVALGAVATNMTVGSKFVVAVATLAPYTRVKIVESAAAATTVTIDMMFREKED